MKISPTALLATIRLNLIRRPLITTDTAEDCLDVSPRSLLAMIEQGKIFWAWDFGSRGTRKEIRILAHSVVEQITGPFPAIGATKNLNLPEVVGLILPQTRESMRGAELQRLFHVSTGLINKLSRTGEIKRIPENLPKTGPNASPRFKRASLVKLLEKRRIV